MSLSERTICTRSQRMSRRSVNGRARTCTLCPPPGGPRSTMPHMLPTGIDDLDARLILTLAAAPRAGIMELARRLKVARGTVQARLDKLQARRVITGFGPDLDLRVIGYTVLAFVTL